MAFSCSKHKGEDGSHSNQLGANKFFKIVTEPQDQKLKIPTSFIKKFGKNLPDQVTLKASKGSIRKVSLGHYNGDTWLQNGWEEFRDYYSIGFGHMLVFDYDGRDHFNVQIFDVTTMEIEYPIDDVNDHVHNAGCRMPKKEYESDDDSAAIITDFGTELTEQAKCSDIGGKQYKYRGRVGTIVNRQTCIAFKKAESFKSVNPCYVSLMQPSYVGPPFSLKLPLSFMKEKSYGTRKKLEFRVHGENTWTVWCSIGRRAAHLTTGWKKFLKENALKVGDACVFEVNKRDDSIWNIIIFRS